MLPAEGRFRSRFLEQGGEQLPGCQQVWNAERFAADRIDFFGHPVAQVAGRTDVADFWWDGMQMHAVGAASLGSLTNAAEERLAAHGCFPSLSHQSRKRVGAGTGKSRFCVQPCSLPGSRFSQR